MQSLAKSGYTAAQVIAALHSSKRELHFRYDLLTPSNVFKRAMTEVESASIQLNTFAEIRRTARFNIRDEGTINFLTDRIKAYARVQVQTVATVTQPAFSRASTAYDQAGNEVAIDIPRYEDAAAGFGKAVCVEEGTENIWFYSDPDDLAEFYGYSNVTLTSGIAAFLAAGVYYGDNSVQRYAYRRPDLQINTGYTISAYVRMDDGNAPTPSNSSTAGDFSLILANNHCGTPHVVDLGGGLYRVWAYRLMGGSITLANTGVYKYTGQSAKGFKISGFQVEAKTYVTSHMPTNGATATRAAETLTTPKAGAFSDAEGTLQWRIKPLRSYGTNHQYVFDGGGPANKNLQVYISSATGKPTLVYGAGAAEVTITSSGAAVASGTHYGIGWRWSDDGVTLYWNGAPVGHNDTPPGFVLGDTNYRGSKADGTLQFDGLSYDSRISSIARTDAQFLADYAAAKPLQIDRWTTCLTPFNDSLLAGQWPQLVTGYAEFPLGVFLLSTPPKKADVAGNIMREVEAYDQTQVLTDDKTTDRYTIAAGTNYVTAVGTILTAAGITDQALTATASTLPVDRDWPPGTKQLTIINDLLNAINYRALWFNEDGRAVAQPYVSPSTRASEYTYADDDESVTFPEVVENLDLFGVPNKWVLTVSEPDRATLLSTVTNANATSPTSTVNRGRTIVEVRSNIDAPDQTTLDAIAAKIAYEASQVYQEVEFETAIMPQHSDLDVLTLTFSKLSINAKFSETGWSFDCRAGARHQHKIRRVVTIA